MISERIVDFNAIQINLKIRSKGEILTAMAARISPFFAARRGRRKKMGRCWREKGNRRGNGAEKMKGGYAMHENRRAQGDREGVWAECDLCGREIGWGESYYRVGGENVCRNCLADFAAQILRVYEVRGGEDV